MIHIGIDPGKSGGYALIVESETGRGVFAYPWDDDLFAVEMNAAAAASHGDIMACVEKVGAMPGQGVSSMFSFGKSAGYIEGVLKALGIPYQLIPPRKWKGEFGLNGSKDKSIEVCKRLFPDVNLRASSRCRKDSDGMAEALLLALYARRKL